MGVPPEAVATAAVTPAAPTHGLDFLSALRSGRPFRRRLWVTHGPAANADEATVQELAVRHVWIYPCVAFQSAAPGGQSGPGERSIFRSLATGSITSPTLSDLLALDWEVMP